MVLVVLHANRCGWVGGYWPCATCTPACAASSEAISAPAARPPAQEVRMKNGGRRRAATANRARCPAGPAPHGAMEAGMAPRPHRRTPGYLVRRADSRKESDTSARAAPRERARDLSRQAAHKCSVKVSSLTYFSAIRQHVSGIESGETQNTRTQHSLVCAQPVDSQSQRLAHAPKVPPHERHRGTQCHGCRPPK
jgi:hypothetical protein